MGDFDFNGLFNHLFKYMEKLVAMFYQIKSWLENPKGDNAGWEEKE